MRRPFSILLPDLHHPVHNKLALKAVFSFIRRNASQIRSVVFMGDNQDCSQFSRHNKNKPGLIRKGGVQEEAKFFCKDVLDVLESYLSKETELVYMLGNHEDWLKQWLEENPEWDGALSVEKLLSLKERGWKVIQQGEYHTIGKLLVLHGDTIGSGQYVARKLVETHCSSAVMGHCHTFSAFTKCSHVRKRDKWIGVTLPTLGTTNPDYNKGAPNQHIHGFGIVESYGEGMFNLYVPIIINGEFSFGGRVYSGK